MIPIRRLRAAMRDAGSLSDHVNLWGFVSDTVFVTKSGAVGCVLRLRGVDDECLEHAQRQQITQSFLAALRHFDQSFRIYQYILRTPVTLVPPAETAHSVVTEALQRRHRHLSTHPKALYASELYLVILHEPAGATRSRWGRSTP